MKVWLREGVIWQLGICVDMCISCAAPQLSVGLESLR